MSDLRSIVSSVTVLTLAFVLCGPTAPPAPAQDIFIQLDDEGFDMALDEARQKLYVSVPNTNEVVIISQVTGQVLNRIDLRSSLRAAVPELDQAMLVGTQPHGLDLSLDGNILFVALNQASSVVYVDLDTLALTQVVIGAELGDTRTWDVVEGKPDRIFASANPGSSGFAYITMIKRDEGNAASRVADSTIVRARPVFARSPDLQFLYVGAGFSPNSLYKLDLSTDEAPIVLEDEHGSVSGTDHLDVSPDGNRIYLGSGQVLQTSDFIQIGLVGSGVPRTNADGSLVYVAQEPGSVQVYETSFFSKVDEIDLPCSFNNIRAFMLLNDGDSFLLLGDDNVCGSGSVSFQIPTCDVAPSFMGDTLNMSFEVATPEPAVWHLWLSANSTMLTLWSVNLPALDPAVQFDTSFPGFPPLGTIGLLSTLVTNTGGITCSDWETVDSGSSPPP